MYFGWYVSLFTILIFIAFIWISQISRWQAKRTKQRKTSEYYLDKNEKNAEEGAWFGREDVYFGASEINEMNIEWGEEEEKPQ